METTTTIINPDEMYSYIGDVILIRLVRTGQVMSAGKLGSYQRTDGFRGTEIHYANTEQVFNARDGFHMIEVA